MTYALLLSLFFHLFHPPHTSTSKHSVYIRKGEISPFTLVYWAQQIIFLVYMRSAGTGDCWIDVLLFGLRLVLRGQVARHRSRSCGPLWYRSVHLPGWAFPTHTDSLPTALSPSWSLTFPFCACYISHQGAFKRELKREFIELHSWFICAFVHDCKCERTSVGRDFWEILDV